MRARAWAEAERPGATTTLAATTTGKPAARPGWGQPGECRLRPSGGAEALASRAEDDERLVAAQLDRLAAATGHDLSGHPRKGSGQLCGCLVPVLLSEARVAAHVRDQECP